MKILLYAFLFLLIFTPNSFAMEIQGGVKYDVDSAREYVQEAQRNIVEISGPFLFKAENTEKVVYSYNNSGEVIGITVQYINDSKKAYIYDRNNNLIYMEKYDKPISIYPHRGYRYNLEGKLVLTSLTVSKNEMFRFEPQGRLLAHSINGVIYDEYGKKIGTARK